MLSPEREVLLKMSWERVCEDISGRFDSELTRLRKTQVSSTAEKKRLLSARFTELYEELGKAGNGVGPSAFRPGSILPKRQGFETR